MKLKDSFRLSLNSITHRKLRAWLTLLGIIIGVAAVVAIVSIGEGAQASVNQRLAGFGADIITISPGGARAGLFTGGFRGGAGIGQGGFREISAGGGAAAGRASNLEKDPELTKLDVSVINGNPNVQYVNEVVSGREQMRFLSETSNAQIQGVNPLVWTQTNSLELASGRFLAASDSSAVVIGDRLANSTFKEPITPGRKITLNDSPFTVVGILKPSLSAGGFGGAGGGDNIAYIPYQGSWQVTDVNKGTFSSLQVKVYDKDYVDQTVTELTESLLYSRKVTERTQDFSITSSQAIRAQVEGVTQSLTIFLGAIAAVSLVVGAVGIANSMFTSVLEKNREIGIMKALGATDEEVLKLFLIESAIFGLIGGVIGAAIGTAISSLIPLLGIGIGPGGGSTLVTPQLLIIAVLISTIVGIVSGVVPARSASKLKPIEALRYE